MDMPSTLSTLTRLEQLTIRADLEFYFSSGNFSEEAGAYTSSISTITGLIKTASFLKHLTLAFNFRLNKRAYIPKASEFICIPLVGLLTECRSASISLCAKALCDGDRSFDATFLAMVLFVLTSCSEVNQLVKQGVLIIIPEKLATPPANG